jgi:acyl carrier protein
LAVSSDRIAQRLRELLAFQVGAPEASLSAASTPQNTPGWDSVANLTFMAAVEEEFSVTIEPEDMMNLRSLGDIAAYLDAHPRRG